MSEYDALLDPAVQAADRERARKNAQEDQAVRNRMVDEDRARERQRCAAFVDRHRRAGWPIAQTGLDPLTGVGSPTLQTARSARVNLGKLYEYHGGLYIQDARYPSGLEWQRYYQPQSDRVIWWDAERSLRMFERIPAELEALALEWAANQGVVIPPDTKGTRRGKKRLN